MSGLWFIGGAVAGICVWKQTQNNSSVYTGRYVGFRCNKINPNVKTIHFVRHGEAEHNAAAKKDKLAYLREDLEDPQLTELGISQCKTLKENSLNSLIDVKLVVISPLTRTLQTATEAFPSLIDRVPWVAVEEARERTGHHPCDRRQPISTKAKKFMHVDFSEIVSDKDELYAKYGHNRESAEDMEKRAKVFMKWLSNRPEKDILVVTHHSYLLNLMKTTLKTPDEKDEIDFENCELRTFVVNFDSLDDKARV